MTDWVESVERAAAGEPAAVEDLIDRFQDMAVGFVWTCGSDPNLEEVRAMLGEDLDARLVDRPQLLARQLLRGGTAPLAAWTGAREVARLLVEHGANLMAVDSRYGGRAAGWALENARPEMARFLESLRS